MPTPVFQLTHFSDDSKSSPCVQVNLLDIIDNDLYEETDASENQEEAEYYNMYGDIRFSISPTLIKERITKFANGEQEVSVSSVFEKVGISSTELGKIIAQHLLELANKNTDPNLFWAVSKVSYGGYDDEKYDYVVEEFLTVVENEAQAKFIGKLLESDKGQHQCLAMSISVHSFNKKTLDPVSSSYVYLHDTGADKFFSGDAQGNQTEEYEGELTCRDAATEYLTLLGKLVANRLPVSSEVFALQEVEAVCNIPDEITDYYRNNFCEIESAIRSILVP